VTTVAIVMWLVAWFGLNRLWGIQKVAAAKVNVLASARLAVGFLLTFPPFMDLRQDK
jgi:hypothetical protein